MSLNAPNPSRCWSPETINSASAASAQASTWSSSGSAIIVGGIGTGYKCGEFRVAQHQSFNPHAAGRYDLGEFGAFEDAGQFGEQYAAGVYFNGTRLGGINQACGCSIPQQAGGDDVGIQHQSHGNVLAGGLSAPLGAVGGNFGFDFFHG